MGNANFELKYIETRWHDKSTLLEVNESLYSISIDEISNEIFEVQTTIYPKVVELNRSQFAISYTSQNVNIPPVIVLADGNTIPLKRIVNPESKKVWWIEHGAWDKKNKSWSTSTHKTAGKIIFKIGKQTLYLNINLVDASKEDLDKYLVDFKSGMWELILDENSYILGEAKQEEVGVVDESVLKIVDTALTHAKNILKKPKSELREVQIQKPYKEVKPVPRTFMELVTKGNARSLTSRGSEPNYNVPENGYVLYSLISMQRIVSQLCRVSRSKIERLKNNLQSLEERLFDLKDFKTINRDLVVKDYKKAVAEQDINAINAKIRRDLISVNGCELSQGYEWYIRITKKNKYGAYFCLFLLNNEWVPYGGCDFSSINLSEKYENLFLEYTDYRIFADISYQIVGNGNIAILSLNSLSVIEIIGNPGWLVRKQEKLEKMKQEAILLSKNGWKKYLTKQELDEQAKERSSIINRKEYFNKQHKNISYVATFLTPKEKQLRDIIKHLFSLGVKPLATFPNSMTFVQNPSYQAIHASYNKLKNQVGLTDEDVLMSLERIDNIGLVDITVLYERWCLLQLIKSFRQNFRFEPEISWKRKLLKILENKLFNEPIKFINQNSRRNILLSYEPRLENGKTPDFVLDLISENKAGGFTKKRVVFDAKFYSQAFMVKRGGISGVVKELALDKNYSEDERNAVFIFHPVTEALKDAGGPVSPQGWGNVSYLGELKLFDWDNC
ncbi:hypothetical protein ACFO3I_18560 [Rheinheimera marina]|uniref:Restriction endonuclease n=1 Tax=Rheinheimera marina TaxID=1774958 RepID=A0ABV9JRZ7_9GAMM